MASSGGTVAGTQVVTPELSYPSSLASKDEVVLCQLVQQTYDLPPAMEEETPQAESEDGASESDSLPDATVLSDIIASEFFPLFLQFMTYITNFFHSLVLVHAARWIASPLATPPDWVGLAPDCIAWFLATDSNGRALDWPPPGLIGLALLTIVALVVHPDGFTWILFRKLRSGMLSLLQSSTSWWALIVNDYGTIISSLLALATFVSLFFLVYVLHKTLSPRGDTSRPISADKQKKKKRRGNHHQKGNRSGGRIKGAPQQQQQRTMSPVESPEHALETLSTIDSEKEEMIVQGNEHVFSLPALVEGKPLSPSLPTSVPSPERLIKALKEDTAPSRMRITSASTIDSTNFSDDESCGTVSGRSTPTTSAIVAAATESVPVVSASTVGRAILSSTESAPAVSAKSAGRAILPVAESVPSVPVSIIGRADNAQMQPLATSSRKQSSRRVKKHENDDVSKAPASSVIPVAPTSRWDALKPNRSVGASRRVQPNGRTGPNQGVRFHSVQNRPNQQPALVTPIARPTIHSPTLSPAEPIHSPILGPNLVVPQEVISPVAASLQSCEIGASTWSQLPTMSYEDTPLTGLLAPFARSPERKSSVAETYFATPLRASEQTTFFSSELNAGSSELNANSPSWSQTNTASLAAPSIGSVRAPPGLTLADGGKGLQSSFSPAANDSPFLSTYPSLSVRSSPRFTTPSLVSYNVKENPFDESDNDENDDLIEAELQELGGQMVGSILDF